MEAKEYQRLAAIEDSHWWYRAIHELVDNVCKSLTFTSQKSDFKILDAGCGSGGLTKKLEKFGRVIGLDISPLALTLARKRKIQLVEGSVNDLPFGKNSFSLGVSISVLYHLRVDEKKPVKEFYRILVPGGKLLLVLPAFSWAWGSHDEAVHTRKRYTLSEAVSLVESSGFRVTDDRYIFSFLFPVFIIKRLMEKVSAKQREISDLETMPWFLNDFLFWLCRVEWRLGRYIKLPFGSSLLIVGEKMMSLRGARDPSAALGMTYKRMSPKDYLFGSFRRRLVDRDLFRYRHLLIGAVLDLGGGRTRGNFPHGKQLDWTVLDIDFGLKPTVVGDAQKLPFANNVFDAVKCSELTGYLFEPIKTVEEIFRIIKPGGAAVITAPFLTPFDSEQHDNIRLTSAWWEWAAKKSGFHLERVEPQGFLLTVLADFERYWISHWWFPLRYAAYILMFPVYEILFWYEKHLPVPKYFQRFTTGFLVLLKKPN